MFLAVISGTTASFSYYTSSHMGSAIDAIAASASAIRNHTIGDMLHDGMRADVYAALIRSEAGTNGEETIKQTQEHAMNFRERIAATKASVNSADAGARLSALDKPLEDYISQALAIVQLAFKDRKAAQAQMASFDMRFSALETSMAAAGDALEQEAMTARANASEARSLADVVTIGSIIIVLLTAAGLFVTVLHSIVRPISDIETTMRAISAGNAAIDIPHAKRGDEIGSMARTIGVFRQSIAERAIEERDRNERELATSESRRRTLAETAHQIGEVVDAAAQGDFSRRVIARSGHDDMAQLVTGINTINDVIDDATAKFAQVLEAIAEGDLTRMATTEYSGRLGEVSGSINMMVARLSQMVAVIKETVDDVSASAGEISSGADNLSQRTEEQASSLQETAATTEQLAASVKASAQASQQAAALAAQATSVARAGGEIVADAVTAMNRIESASRQITEITSVIDNIAFQTNLLALNAAVEAARAGDAGKGFAVVASEVRTLAQRSSEAAKGISELISTSTDEITQGVKLVRSAGEVLGQIVEASQKVAGTIAEISAASAEQANGIDEMSRTVAHMDEMTQQNAALAEQSAASALTLGNKIGQLSTLIDAFRTKADAGRSSSRRSIAAELGPEQMRRAG
jgi:methyl-accepting chemotaxis protein